MADQVKRERSLLPAVVTVMVCAMCLVLGAATSVAQDEFLDPLAPYVEGEVWPPEDKSVSSGLLGNGYFQLGYRTVRPKDSYTREISEWTGGALFAFNFPLTKYFDWQTTLSTESLSGHLPGSDVEVDSTLANLDTMILYHFRPSETIRPFVGIGIGSQRMKVEFSDGFARLEDEFSTEYFKIKSGFELVFSDVFSLQTYFTTAETFDKPSFDTMAKENIAYFVDSTLKVSDRFFLGMGVNSDFRVNDIGFTFMIGSTY